VDRSQSLIPDAPLLSCLAKRNQLPLSVRCRCLLSKDVDIPVIRLDLVEDALWVVPLIEHSLDLVLPFSKPEANGSLIGFSACIALYVDLHHFNCGPVSNIWHFQRIEKSSKPSRGCFSAWHCSLAVSSLTVPASVRNGTWAPHAKLWSFSLNARRVG